MKDVDCAAIGLRSSALPAIEGSSTGEIDGITAGLDDLTLPGRVHHAHPLYFPLHTLVKALDNSRLTKVSSLSNRYAECLLFS